MTTTAEQRSQRRKNPGLIEDVLVGDRRTDPMKSLARACLMIGAFFMPMLSFRILGKTTATTESGLTVSDLFFFFSLAALTFSRTRRKLPPTPAWYVGVAFVVVSGVFATFHAQASVQSIFADARMLFVLLIWQWTIRHLIDDEGRIRKIMTSYIVGATTSAFAAILQLEGHLFVSIGTLINGRASGLAKHPDDTGSLLALGLAFSVGLAMHSKGRRRYAYIAMSVIIAMGLICTGSVSGMLTGAAGALISMVLGGITPKQIFVVAFIAVVAYVGALSIQGANGTKSLNPIARFERATGPEAGGSNSIGPREGTWRGAWHGIVNSPFLGHGLDIYSGVTYTDPFNNTAEETHDIFLMGWYQGGFFFLLGELICIAEGFRRTWIGGRVHPIRTTIFAGGVTVL
ncbi:MAG TPA: O-antigen ligase family protein, partial [Acidimicrobiales bacterium]